MNPLEMHLGDFRTFSHITVTITGSNLGTCPSTETKHMDPKEGNCIRERVYTERVNFRIRPQPSFCGALTENYKVRLSLQQNEDYSSMRRGKEEQKLFSC